MKQLGVIRGSSFLDSTAISARVYAIVQFAETAAFTARETVSSWVARAQGRKDLARLSLHMMQDIGLEPFQVHAEINKPFWKK